MVSERQEQASFTIFITYFVIALLVSGLALLAGRGLENLDNLYKFVFYMAFVLGLGLWAAYDLFALKGENKVFVFFHNPGVAVLKDLRWRWINNPLRLLLLSMLVFIPIYIITVVSAQKTFFIGYVTYQIAESANIFLAIEPAVIAETLILVTLLGFGRWLFYGFSNNGRNQAIYYFGLLVTTAVASYVMYLYHTFRYGGREFELASVFIFFLISAFLIFLTGSIIPAIILHYLNNGIGMASTLFSSDIVILITSISYLIFVALFVSYAVYSKKESGGDRFWTARN